MNWEPPALGTDLVLDLRGEFLQSESRAPIANYVNAYIKCSQCSAPDTHFVKEDRTTLLKCQACGATRPVKL